MEVKGLLCLSSSQLEEKRGGKGVANQLRGSGVECKHTGV